MSFPLDQSRSHADEKRKRKRKATTTISTTKALELYSKVRRYGSSSSSRRINNDAPEYIKQVMFHRDTSESILTFLTFRDRAQTSLVCRDLADVNRVSDPLPFTVRPSTLFTLVAHPKGCFSLKRLFPPTRQVEYMIELSSFTETGPYYVLFQVGELIFGTGPTATTHNKDREIASYLDRFGRYMHSLKLVTIFTYNYNLVTKEDTDWSPSKRSAFRASLSSLSKIPNPDLAVTIRVTGEAQYSALSCLGSLSSNVSTLEIHNDGDRLCFPSTEQEEEKDRKRVTYSDVSTVFSNFELKHIKEFKLTALGFYSDSEDTESEMVQDTSFDILALSLIHRIPNLETLHLPRRFPFTQLHSSCGLLSSLKVLWVAGEVDIRHVSWLPSLVELRCGAWLDQVSNMDRQGGFQSLEKLVLVSILEDKDNSVGRWDGAMKTNMEKLINLKYVSIELYPHHYIPRSSVAFQGVAWRTSTHSREITIPFKMATRFHTWDDDLGYSLYIPPGALGSDGQSTPPMCFHNVEIRIPNVEEITLLLTVEEEEDDIEFLSDEEKMEGEEETLIDWTGDEEMV